MPEIQCISAVEGIRIQPKSIDIDFGSGSGVPRYNYKVIISKMFKFLENIK